MNTFIPSFLRIRTIFEIFVYKRIKIFMYTYMEDTKVPPYEVGNNVKLECEIS